MWPSNGQHPGARTTVDESDDRWRRDLVIWFLTQMANDLRMGTSDHHSSVAVGAFFNRQLACLVSAPYSTSCNALAIAPIPLMQSQCLTPAAMPLMDFRSLVAAG
jgi:hypothetical protein